MYINLYCLRLVLGGLMGALATVALADTRDPLWVLLSDNADVGLPRFETGATYTSTPTPTSPAELSPQMIASAQGGGLGRLQDAGRPTNSDETALGWNAPRVTVTFDLKRVYQVEAVELLLMSAALPDEVQVESRLNHAAEWKPGGALRRASGTGNFWQLIRFETPRRAAQVRLVMESKQGRVLLREARIWGRLDEAELAPDVSAGRNEKDNAVLTLIHNGEARSAIVVGPEPTLKTVGAARLLQDMLSRMTGVLLPVTERSPRTDVPRLRVGPSAAAECCREPVGIRRCQPTICCSTCARRSMAPPIGR